MQASTSDGKIGCIGKCTIGISCSELDKITDSIYTTLGHPKGRQIFRKYLQKSELRDNVECFDIYLACRELASKLSSSTSDTFVEELKDDFCKIKEMLEDLDGISHIDLQLLKSYDEALSSNSRTAMLELLEDTKERLYCCLLAFENLRFETSKSS
ncbi:uncharacterized protein [Prorops nasuta]|uniref:uncharacterized protein isoform X1 n=1 Tax=Prorops nasuta TaxID=863751 RepID=UPI0034CDB565